MRRVAKHARVGLATGRIVLVAAGALWIWLAASPRAPLDARKPDLHSFLHINCKHHVHGAAWHKDHGRILGAKGGERDAGEIEAPQSLRR